jgi:hypothetical protein
MTIHLLLQDMTEDQAYTPSLIRAGASKVFKISICSVKLEELAKQESNR